MHEGGGVGVKVGVDITGFIMTVSGREVLFYDVTRWTKCGQMSTDSYVRATYRNGSGLSVSAARSGENVAEIFKKKKKKMLRSGPANHKTQTAR